MPGDPRHKMTVRLVNGDASEAWERSGVPHYHMLALAVSTRSTREEPTPIDCALPDGDCLFY